jgi:hypothetical protein
MAQRDPRVMAELQAAMSRHEAPEAVVARSGSQLAVAAEQVAQGLDAAFERKARFVRSGAYH